MYFRYPNGCCPGTKWESEKETCIGLFKNDTFYHVITFKISSDIQPFSKNSSFKLKKKKPFKSTVKDAKNQKNRPFLDIKIRFNSRKFFVFKILDIENNM